MNNQQKNDEPNSPKPADEEKEVKIEKSESESPQTGDPGRTPGKAEGEDDESATD